jgi:hypothetical protein
MPTVLLKVEPTCEYAVELGTPREPLLRQACHVHERAVQEPSSRIEVQT